MNQMKTTEIKAVLIRQCATHAATTALTTQGIPHVYCIFQHRLILSVICKLLKLPPAPLTDFKLLKWNKTGT